MVMFFCKKMFTVCLWKESPVWVIFLPLNISQDRGQGCALIYFLWFISKERENEMLVREWLFIAAVRYKFHTIKPLYKR